MAIEHYDDLPLPERFDGAFRCRLCPDTLPRDDNEYCIVAHGVVCEDCCRELMMGDARMIEAVSHRRGHELTSEDVIAQCMECERLLRLVTEHGSDEGPAVRRPLH